MRANQEQYEIDHLEADGPKSVPGVSPGSTQRFPRHVWQAIAVDAPGERCSRCKLERYGYPERTQYRLSNGHMREGAEPSCKRGKDQVTK